MKKQKKEIFKDPRQLKQKLMAALSMVIVAGVLLSTVTFAWLVMSIAPEVRGISTNVGANGSLEIALLNSQTKLDLSKIPSGVAGASLANGRAEANYTWGNLLDVGSADFGLDGIMLMPSRLNVSENGDGHIVNSGMLSVPTYGYDGRITELTNNTISTVYTKDTGFMYTYGQQSYGVRAIGTSNTITVQGSALAMAKSNVSVGQSTANSITNSTWSRNGASVLQILIDHALDSSKVYTDIELGTIKAMVADLKSSASYIETALRNGLVAFAASAIENADDFTIINNKAMDTTRSLSEIIAEIETCTTLSVPSEFNTWVTKLSNLQNNLAQAESECNMLTGNSYAWIDIRGVLTYIMNVEYTYIDDTPYSKLDSSFANTMMNASEFTITLAPGSGAFVDIADFAGNVNTTFTAINKAITVKTETLVSPTYLSLLYTAVDSLSAAGGETAGSSVEMTSTFGYAIDMAFRCNAKGVSKLLLQTDPEERVYDGNNSGSTMGGGSYMEFSSEDESFDIAQRIKLMDAIRVGFMDDQGNLLGIAKLNTSNRVITDGVVKAPLYLYNYSFSTAVENKGALIMDERQKENNELISLDQNVAKAITAFVWLDGDIVDNTMVSATAESSLNGVLNLQFATDANLVPANNADLKNLTPDKSSLQKVVDSANLIYGGGNNNEYTAVSWKKFASAYTYAVSVNNNAVANETQIMAAQVNLVTAQQGLVKLTHEALKNAIKEIRDMMGKTEDLARYVIVGEDGNYVAIDPYTNEQIANKVGEIYRVNYAMNLLDEGNNVKTPVYTDESWSALAATLYDTEALDMNAKATEEQIDNAISALTAAKEALQRRVYFTPYDFEGNIFYMAISDEADTYGKWYTSEFKRITSDLKILELDARATPVEIAKMIQPEYIENGAYAETVKDSANYYLRVEPTIEMLSLVYPELKEEDIIAIGWSSSSEEFVAAVSQAQINSLSTLSARAEELGLGVKDAEVQADIDAAKAILEGNNEINADVVNLNALIADLKAAVEAEEKRIQDEEAAKNTLMTADYRVLLNAAIEAALASDAYGAKVTETATDEEGNEYVVETEEFKNQALRDATVAAQALLAQETAQQADAVTVLDTLNTQLAAVGLRTYTYDNFIEHYIPVGSERYEVVYDVDNPTGLLYFTADTNAVPSTEIKAVVLTKNGVVFTLTKTVEVYIPAFGAEIKKGDAVVEEYSTVQMTSSGVVKLSAALENALTAEGAEIATTEEIASYQWTTSDPEVLSLSNAKSKDCTVKALKSGSASITVSVTTVQGNTYYETIYIEF